MTMSTSFTLSLLATSSFSELADTTASCLLDATVASVRAVAGLVDSVLVDL